MVGEAGAAVEAVPEALSILAKAIIEKGAQAVEMAPRKAGAPEADVDSISSDESPEVAEPPYASPEVANMAESSRAGCPRPLCGWGSIPSDGAARRSPGGTRTFQGCRWCSFWTTTPS